MSSEVARQCIAGKIQTFIRLILAHIQADVKPTKITSAVLARVYYGLGSRTYIYIYIYICEVYKDHHVMACIGNRINLHLFLTILTMLRKSWFYQYKIIVLSLSCHSPERWPHGGSCVAVLRSSTPEIDSLLVHLYSGVAQSTAVPFLQLCLIKNIAFCSWNALILF